MEDNNNNAEYFNVFLDKKVSCLLRIHLLSQKTVLADKQLGDFLSSSKVPDYTKSTTTIKRVLVFEEDAPSQCFVLWR